MPPALLKWWPMAVLLLFFVIVGGGYVAGYRLAPGPHIVRLAHVTITDLPKGASLYIDEKEQKNPTNGALSLMLFPGEHGILALADGYWPWATIIEVPPGGSTEHSFLIPRSPKVSILTGTAKRNAQTLLASAALPSDAHPLQGDCVRIYASQNQLIAEASSTAGCTPPSFLCIQGACEPTIVFDSNEPLTSVLPYPGRTDALLIAAGPHIYGLALDPRTPRAFAPLLTGSAPKITEEKDGTVVGEDGASIFSLMLP